MIGKHECRAAEQTDLMGAIRIGLDEALTALEESFYDLSDEQVRAFPVPGRNPVAWIVMHALQNLDEYAVGLVTGRLAFEHNERYELWQPKDEDRPKPGDPFPTVQEMRATLETVRRKATTAAEGATEDGLRSKTWYGGRSTAVDAYMRTIFHTMAHVRQIWLLRGAMGLVEGTSWPQQHWA